MLQKKDRGSVREPLRVVVRSGKHYLLLFRKDRATLDKILWLEIQS